MFSDLYVQNGSGCLFPLMSDVSSSSSLRVHHFQPTKNPLHALCFLSSSFFHSSLMDMQDCVFLSFMHVLFCFSYVNKLVFNSSLSFFLSFSLSFSLLQLNPFSEIQQGGTSLSFFFTDMQTSYYRCQVFCPSAPSYIKSVSRVRRPGIDISRRPILHEKMHQS